MTGNTNDAAKGFASLLGASAAATDVTVADKPVNAPAVSTGMTSSSSSVLGTKVTAAPIKVPEAGYKSALIPRLGKVKPTLTAKGVHYFDKEVVDADKDAKARAEALVASGRMTAY